MTKQTNEELREKIGVVLDNYRDAIRHGVMFIDNPYLEVIMSLIPQHEQLEVVISEGNHAFLKPHCIYSMDGKLVGCADGYLEALDFCKRFNLKVTNEPEGGIK